MKISSEINSASLLVGEEKAIELMAKAGFDAWDLSMFCMTKVDWSTSSSTLTDHPLAGPNYLDFVRKLKQVGLDNGIHCNQSHAPFPSQYATVEKLLKRSIECTAEAGGEICVIHPKSFGTPEENAEMYLSLLPFAKEHGVKIATENMWSWDSKNNHAAFASCATAEDFNANLDAVNDDFFVACLDIGHAEMRGNNTTAPQMIRALGKRLKALHIHDNNLKNDSHQIPFSMDIDFDAVVDALREIGYDGYFTLEADAYLRDYTAETAFEGIQKLAESAKRLAAMFEV